MPPWGAMTSAILPRCIQVVKPRFHSILYLSIPNLGMRILERKEVFPRQIFQQAHMKRSNHLKASSSTSCSERLFSKTFV